MNAALLLLLFGIGLLTACVLSLWSGKTVGLYGIMETRASIFYWIIVITYGMLGVMSLLVAVRMVWRP